MGKPQRAGGASERDRLTLRTVVIALSLLAPTLLVSARPAGAADAPTTVAAAPVPASPTATVTPADLAAGQSYVLRGRGFAAGSQVAVATCTFASPTSCNQATATSADVSADGELALRADAGRPPGGCPCVLRVSTADGGVVVEVPVNLDGVAGPDPSAVARQQADARGSARIAEVHLDAETTVGSLLGAAPVATLAFTVENTGSVPIPDAPIVLAFRRDGSAQVPLASPSLGRLAPGERRTLRVAVPLGAFAFGSYEVSGHVIGLDGPVDFTARTSSYPWGLILLGLVACAVAIGLIALRRRRWRARRTAAPLALPAPVRALGPGAAALPAGSGPVSARRGAAVEPVIDLDLEPSLVALLTEVIPTLPARIRALEPAGPPRTGSGIDQLAAQLAHQLASSLATRRSLTTGELDLIERHLGRELRTYLLALATAMSEATEAPSRAG